MASLETSNEGLSTCGFHLSDNRIHLMEWTQPHFLTASINGPRWVHLDHLQEEK